MKKKSKKAYKYIKDEVLKELITDDSKDSVIEHAEELYKDKEKCLAILAKFRLDSIINYRRPALEDGIADANFSLSAAYLNLRIRVDRGIVTVVLENYFKRHHEPRTIYEGKWEDI
jgi:hypothetical protein